MSRELEYSRAYVEELKRIHTQLLNESAELYGGADEGGGDALDDLAQNIEIHLFHKYNIEWTGVGWECNQRNPD